MSLLLNGFHLADSILRKNLLTKVTAVKLKHFSSQQFDARNRSYQQENESSSNLISAPISKDRTKVIPVETSIKYLKSDAYKRTYGNLPVWTHYKLNFEGQYAPKVTRKTCIRNNIITTGNPCPICRDEYLIIDPRNIDLLKQFISEFSGEVLTYKKTGVCQKVHKKILIAIIKAKDCGFLTYDVPFRIYDYSEWRPS